MYHNIVRVTCVFILWWGLASTVFAAAPLRVVTEENYFPFSYRQADGLLVGFDVDISKALCVRLKKECVITAMPFNDIIPAAQAGKVDLIVAGLAKSAAREQQLAFVAPYYRSRTAIVGKAGTHFGKVSAETMRGKRIATQEGTVQQQYVQQQFGTIATIIPTVTVHDGFLLLQKGAADVFFADSLVCMALLIKEEAMDLDYVAEPLGTDHESSQAFIAIPLGRDDFLQQVREAFSSLRSSNEFYTINQKYFPFSIY